MIKKSKIHGLGMFADENYFSGEIILEEQCVAIAIQYSKLFEDTGLAKYTCMISGISSQFIYLSGQLRFLNGSDDNNAEMMFYLQEDGSILGKLICIRRILKGEEIFINYENEQSEIIIASN